MRPAPATAAPIEDAPPIRRTLRLLHASRRDLSVVLAAILMFAALSLTTQTFLTELNLFNLLRQVAILGIIAVGSTFIFIAGEIDLSIGSMHGLLAIVFATLVIRSGLNPFAAMPFIVAGGALIGALNGFVSTKLRVPSFIVTLGMLSILKGSTLVFSGGMPVSGSMDVTFRSLVAGRLFGMVPAQLVWLLGIVAVGIYLLKYTRFGYDVFATGGNKSAAQAVGIRTDRVKILAFALSGAVIGVTSCILVGWFRGVDPQAGNGLELSIIAAVIIGGTGLFGGVGSVTGTLIGTLIIGMISNGTVLLGVNSYYEPIAQGGVIVLAVLVDVWSSGRR